MQDWEDILEGARQDVRNRPVYRNAYYRGGYPPDNEGVCTDVIWRAFKNAGYDILPHYLNMASISTTVLRLSPSQLINRRTGNSIVWAF